MSACETQTKSSMIKLDDKIWIGNSGDEEFAKLEEAGIGAILNVAQDLQCSRGWNTGIEYTQVGLIDGPGNSLCAYQAAILALTALVKNKKVLVCCHTGARSLAVVLMYLNVENSRGWNGNLLFLKERIEDELPEPHPAHWAAFDKMNWISLRRCMRAGD